MIIYMSEDHAYRHWITRHRQGYVLDGRHKPQLGSLVLHRAVCADIKLSTTKTTHWTTGDRLKACSLLREELETWATIESGLELTICPRCHLEQEFKTSNEQFPTQLPKMGRDVLDYIVESALIHMEWQEGPPYRLNVADIASCMGTSVGHVTPVLQTLMTDGFVWLPGISTNDTAIPVTRLVLPTPLALKPLSGFAEESAEQLQAQLDKLLVEHS